MAQAEPERWFILGRRVLLGDDDDALDDPDLHLKLPLDRPPPRITRLTALTRVGGVVRGELSIVARSHKDLLLHEHGRPAEPNNPNIFFVALDTDTDFMPDDRAAAAAAAADRRSVFDVIATRLLDRLPGLPHFSSVRNVGFLSLPRRNRTYVAAELQANNLQAGNGLGLGLTVPFITCRCRSHQANEHLEEDDEEPDPDPGRGRTRTVGGGVAPWHLADLHWPVVGDAANPQWTNHDVIAHDKKLWWVNLSRGLLHCDPLPVGDLESRLEYVPLPVLAGFQLQDRHEPPEYIDRYRVVGVSAGQMRFVDVARRRNDPVGETRVVVWTLDLPELVTDARWQNNPSWQTTLANIWDSANYGQMPRDKVPVVALVHPNEPAVVYFFLDQYVFSVDVNQSAVVDLAVMPDEQDGVPRPINQRDVLAWKRPPFKTVPLQVPYEKKKQEAKYG